MLVSSYEVQGIDDMYQMRATAYILTGTTASGQQTRHGICASGNREWLGKTVMVYQRTPDNELGEFIGIYEVLDTGCSKHVIDVWCDGIEEAEAFMRLVESNGCGGKIYVQLIDAEG